MRSSLGLVNIVLRRGNLDQLAAKEERRLVGDARGLLHVVRHDDDGDVGAQLVDELLDFLRADRIERRSRLVEQEHLRIGRQRACDAEALLLAAGKSRRARLQSIPHLVPERGALERALDDLVGLLRRSACGRSTTRPAATLSRMDIVGNGVGRWKTMPTCRLTATGLMPLP